MRSPLRISASVAGGLLLASASAIALGTRRWARATDDLVARLDAGDDARFDAPFDPGELDELPPPVVRWLTRAIPAGAALPRRAVVAQAGEFLVKDGRWARFTAVSYLAAVPPAFVWDAAIRMAPMVDVRVRDSYVAGTGTMHGAVEGLVTVVDRSGTREMAIACLQRYLAEAVWMPSALLPRAGVAWTPIDDRTARATLADRGVTASVDFHFASDGDVVGISADRYRDVKGTPVLTRWEGTWREHARIGGVLVPTAGEVAWVLPIGRQPYWRGRAVHVEHAR